MEDQELEDLYAKCKKIKLIVIGVDGVLTDAGMYFNEQGDIIRKFNRRDGMGIELAAREGIKTAVISSMPNPIVEGFAKTFGIDFIRLGVDDKWHEIEKLQIRGGLGLDEIAYISDDIDEYEILKQVGMPITVADGMSVNRKISAYVTRRKGGEGAVREAIEVILACIKTIKKD
jgi:3-deoxy-D-manno-octulosonate 8-phosphate phosphatase (KDO 8-P phosphatase)